MQKAEDRARVYRLFLASLDLAPALRAQFLAEECAGDEAIRAEVDALLQISTRDEARTHALMAATVDTDEDLTGHTFGNFRLTGRIGEGGMGVVYRAERVDGVPQAVAIKLVSALGSRQAQKRFERETQHLARLEHPAIARLIDAGSNHGRAWIAMEFVDGRRIDAYCASNALGTRAIVGLVVQIADAVAAAHQMLIVHSDIKPTNVLVTDKGVPKLIDFGISAALRDAGSEASETFKAGSLFSPGYAAPEQIKGNALTVATDVFGLGALAYRLLTGVQILAQVSDPVAYMHAICEQDVSLPSRAAGEARKSPVTEHELRGDLDAILCKALEREPARRYASVVELQADLVRFLEGRPVAARRQTVAYRLGKFARRNALAVGLTAALAVSVVAGAIVAQLQSHREALAREMAARRGEFLESLLKSADPRQGRRDISVAELLDSAAAELDHKLGNEPLVEASMLGLIAQTDMSLGRFEKGLDANERQARLLKSAGGSALDVARAVAVHAELLAALGRWADALPLARDAVDRLRPLHSPTDLCDALYALAVASARTGNEKEAEARYLETLEIESHGNENLQRQRMFPYRGLAVLLGEEGRYPEALNYASEALALARKNLPAGHPDLLAIQVNYAGALVNMHRGSEAEPLLREVIAEQSRVLGEGHKDTLLTQYSLVDDLLELHRDAEAIELARHVARGLEAALGPENTYTLGAWGYFGIASCNVHPGDDALEVLRRVEATRRRVLPPRSWLVYATGVNVGACLLRLQRYDAAKAQLLDATAGLEATRGTGFRRTQAAYHLLQELSVATGQRSEAQAWAKKIGT